MFRVMAGDTVAISAKAFYNIDKTLPGQGVDVMPVLGSAIAALASGGTAPLGEASQLAADLGTTASQSVALLPVSPPLEGQREAAPTAGLKFVLYDAEFEVVEDNTGTKIVEDKINTIQTLATDKMVMQANGFLEVFVDNQAQTPVFFDNLMVTHTPSRVLEVNSYYPSGLLMYGADMTFQAAGDEYNGYKYNSKELQTQMNLGWLDYGARMYDPAVGRWWVPDRFAEKYYNLSPYSYGALNPIKYIDINGDSTFVAMNEDGTYRVTGGNLSNKKDRGIYMKGEDGAYTKVGESMTRYSFFDDKNNPVIGAIIDPNSTEGRDFIDQVIEDDPTVAQYYPVAKDGEFNENGERNIYNIKDQGISEKPEGTSNLQYRYRGSLDKNGRFGSARDFGNYAAGLVTGRHGMGIGAVRLYFDGYESITKGGIKTEPKTTKVAQYQGYWRGIKMYFGFGK